MVKCSECGEAITLQEFGNGYCVKSADSYHSLESAIDVLCLEDEENERPMPDLQYPSERPAFALTEW